MDSVVVDGLTKKFGDTLAVEDVSFNVEGGEIFGFLGPNGAGKTTTIRMMTGILEPDAGSIAIGGMDLRRHPLQVKLKLGCIPEVGNVYQDLSASENMDLFGRFYGLTRREREARSEELLAILGLAERAHDLVRTFSKGMRQRVSIACAVIHNPSVLFLDEPTEGLDVHSKRVIVQLVKKMNSEGTTTILTTHNIEDASKLCQRVCIISRGRIIAVETPEKLRRAYQDIQTLEITFDRAIDLSDFSIAQVVRAEAYGDKWRFYTGDPDATIRHIVQVGQEQRVKILSMATVGPSLEDVFVRLTERIR